MQTMTVQAPTHSPETPMTNRRRKAGHAAVSAEPEGLGSAPAEVGDLHGASWLSGCGAVGASASSLRHWQTREQALLRLSAETEAKQPFASSRRPFESGVRLPTALLRKSPNSTNAVALSASAMNVENCGRYHCGPWNLLRPTGRVTPSSGMAPKKRNDADVARPEDKAGYPVRGSSIPSSSAIMCWTQKSSYLDSTPATARASSSESPRRL
mmetsp:Transcript_13661/g.42696  ORF Transcript_13661/g.42696 Transcript_13661/m.42696 type:complete len:212 (+) Transcript_13661:1034-1669(+)